MSLIFNKLLIIELQIIKRMRASYDEEIREQLVIKFRLTQHSVVGLGDEPKLLVEIK